jgi:hypothetical protein
MHRPHAQAAGKIVQSLQGAVSGLHAVARPRGTPAKSEKAGADRSAATGLRRCTLVVRLKIHCIKDVENRLDTASKMRTMVEKHRGLAVLFSLSRNDFDTFVCKEFATQTTSRYCRNMTADCIAVLENARVMVAG